MNKSEIRSAAKAAAEEWFQQNLMVREATKVRDRALWRFVEAAVKLARAKGIRRRSGIRRLVHALAPQLNRKTASRYVALVRAVVRRSPAGTDVHEWVKARGGISRCR